ncbi:MAG: hypothetical protein L3J58_11110 [Emcibacter sp.]|nr:hypothetical protein [Emcibacter sp.]
MTGKKSTAFLTFIAQRLGRKLGQFMLSVLLLNIFAAAALSATNTGLQDALENDFLSGVQSYIICTPQGLKRITLDENGNPVNPDEGKTEHCIYCLPFHKMVLDNASVEISYVDVGPVSHKPLGIYDVFHLPETPINITCPPRAPPQI